MESLTFASDLNVSPEDLWARVTTPEGILDELKPWLRMTIPKEAGSLSLAELTAPVALGRSWILLLGIVPFDYDDLYVAELREGYFKERSKTMSMTVWQHERTVEPLPTGARLTDTLTWETKRSLPKPVVRRIVGAIFTHRHRRLRSRFG